MIELSQAEWNVYTYLSTVAERGEIVPSYAEIGAACGIRSVGHVGKIITELAACGLVLRHGKRSARALTVMQASVSLRPWMRDRGPA